MAPMQRVAELAHVKAATAPAPALARDAKRIAWHGGKISSNKAEALRKFLARKQRAGDHATLAQIRATQARLGISLEDDAEARTPKKLHATRRPHAKAQESGAHKTLVINGRVVGPRVSTSTAKKPGDKQQRARPAIAVGKTAVGKRGGKPADRIALDKQLDLPLDALVKRGGVRG